MTASTEVVGFETVVPSVVKVEQAVENVQKKGNAVTTKKSVNGENTGRWTKEEHATFIEGLEKHGKEWKKIANMIETRTVVQIRTHAQKYFQKIAKTKYEMKGKQPPTDLVSTASNPNRSHGSSDKKRGMRGTGSKKNVRITYSSSSTSDPKENSPHNGVNIKSKKSSSTAANKRSAPLKPVGTSSVHRKKKKLLPLQTQGSNSGKLNNDNDDRSDDKKPSQLTISTNKLREKYEEEDLQWMKSSLNMYNKMVGASPTSVAEFGVYRSFGEGGNKNDLLSMCDTESLSDWISSTSEGSSIEQPLEEPEPTSLDGEICASDFGLNVDETIASWINSPVEDDDECTLESFSGLNKRLRLNSGDFVALEEVATE